VKPDPNRPRPLVDGIRWLFTPIINWWGFVGTIPALVYLAFGMFAVMLVIDVLRLFLRR
jgi:hypothetical protein